MKQGLKLAWDDGKSLFQRGWVALPRGQRPSAWEHLNGSLRMCGNGHHFFLTVAQVAHMLTYKKPSHHKCYPYRGSTWQWLWFGKWEDNREGHSLLLLSVEADGWIIEEEDKLVARRMRTIQVLGSLSQAEWEGRDYQGHLAWVTQHVYPQSRQD